MQPEPLALPSHEDILRTFIYDPDNGKLLWRRLPDGKLPRNVHKDEAGSMDFTGYSRVRINNQRYFAHRIIWKYVYGDDPKVIDHINGCTSDNRIENLRDVDSVGNARNRKTNVNNTSGVPGVSFEKNTGQWEKCTKGKYSVTIGIGGSKRKLGVYTTFMEALAARRAAEIVLGYADWRQS